MAYTGIINNANTQAVYSTLDIHKPDKYVKLYRQYGSQFAEFLNTVRLMGRGEGVMPVAATQKTVYEKDWEHQNFKVYGTVSGGASQTLVLHSDSVTSGDKYYPRKGFLVMYPDETMGHITNITDAGGGTIQLSISAANGGSLPGVTAGDELMIGGSVWGETSGQPNGVTQNYVSYNYPLQILKESTSISGSELTNMTWFEAYPDGQPAGVWSDATRSVEADLDIGIENELFFGGGGSFTDTLTSETAQEMKGMITWIRQRGNVLAITPSTFDYTDLEDVDAYLTSQGNVSPFVSGWVGRELYTGMSNEFRTELSTAFAGGGADLTSVFMGEDGREERMIEANFNGISLNNRTYLLKRVNTWSNPKTTGTTGYDMSKYGVFMPVSTFEDAKSNEIVPNFGIMHKEKDGYSRSREVWMRKGAGGDTANYDINEDKVQLNVRSHVGLCFPEANKAVLFDPNASA